MKTSRLAHYWATCGKSQSSFWWQVVPDPKSQWWTHTPKELLVPSRIFTNVRLNLKWVRLTAFKSSQNRRGCNQVLVERFKLICVCCIVRVKAKVKRKTELLSWRVEFSSVANRSWSPSKGFCCYTTHSSRKKCNNHHTFQNLSLIQ